MIKLDHSHNHPKKLTWSRPWLSFRKRVPQKGIKKIINRLKIYNFNRRFLINFKSHETKTNITILTLVFSNVFSNPLCQHYLFIILIQRYISSAVLSCHIAEIIQTSGTQDRRFYFIYLNK